MAHTKKVPKRRTALFKDYTYINLYKKNKNALHKNSFICYNDQVIFPKYKFSATESLSYQYDEDSDVLQIKSEIATSYKHLREVIEPKEGEKQEKDGRDSVSDTNEPIWSYSLSVYKVIWLYGYRMYGYMVF